MLTLELINKNMESYKNLNRYVKLKTCTRLSPKLSLYKFYNKNSDLFNMYSLKKDEYNNFRDNYKGLYVFYSNDTYNIYDDVFSFIK